jgi:hypothetical protein
MKGLQGVTPLGRICTREQSLSKKTTQDANWFSTAAVTKLP